VFEASLKKLTTSKKTTTMIDQSSIIGWAGTVAVISLGQWSDLIACICGIATTAYMTVKLIQALKKK
jgi:hypothetical protein